MKRLGVRNFLLGLGIVIAAVPAAAHIGSPNTFFEGQAGPYPIRVMVMVSGVVPGLAEISIRVKEGVADTVTARLVRWDVGVAGSPSPDLATPLRGEPGLYTAELWLMTSGSYSVHVEVAGAQGQGIAIVPVPSDATEQLTMSPILGWILFGLGLLLFVGAVTAVGAAVRESVLTPGVEPDEKRMGRARWAMVGTTAVLALALYGGKQWWESEEAQNAASLFRPLAVSASASVEPSGHRTLVFRIDEEDWRARRWTPIVPDHGKLMHMFLLREPDLDAFAHIHPIKQDEDTFSVSVPPLPAGRYRIYADVTQGSGYAHTMTAEVEIPGLEPGVAIEPRVDALAPDPDDSWHTGNGQGGPVYTFDDGMRMVWEHGGDPLRVDEAFALRLRLEAADGVVAPLENYMGMLSHAAVRRTDGAVFTHLHPTGTVSMAAQALFRAESFQRRDEEGNAPSDAALEASTSGMHSEHGMHEGHAMPAVTTVDLPYAFPKPGTYRIWAQLKSGGRVYTGVFDAEAVEWPERGL